MLRFGAQKRKCVFSIITLVSVLSLILITLLHQHRVERTDKSFRMTINLSTKYQNYSPPQNWTTARLKIKNVFNVVAAAAIKEEDYIQKGSEVMRNLPALPFILGTERQNKERACANYPTFDKIEYSNVLWQVQRQSNYTVYLFGAFWDIRKLNKDAPSIRILGLIDVMDEEVPPNYCQIWFEDQTEPLIVTNYNYISMKEWGYYKNGELLEYIFNCPLPRNYIGTKIPLSVSFVSSPCANATNNLRVHFDIPEIEEKSMIAVCCKGLDYVLADWSMRLIEWIEMLLILGVDKVYMYKFSAHPNMEKVLKYYEELGKIEVSPLTAPAGRPNEPHLRRAYFTKIRQHKIDLIAYNDCLYRNLYKYKFVSLLDLDEIVIPHNGANTWIELIDTLEKRNKKFSTPYYVFSNVGFTTEDRPSVAKSDADIPEYLYMQRHTIRWTKPAPLGGGIKAFHRPEEVLTVQNHYPTSCIGKCKMVNVNMADGFLHHYRHTSAEWTNLNESLATIDNYIWKWKDELIARTNKAIIEMGFNI